MLEKINNLEYLDAETLGIMLYLSDWKNCIEHGQQITENKYKYGYKIEIDAISDKDIDLILQQVRNKRTAFRFCKRSEVVTELSTPLKNEHKDSTLHVVNTCGKYEKMGIIKLALSTFPIITSDMYVDLDLVKKASEYSSWKNP
jgi:hypothetical protein